MNVYLENTHARIDDFTAGFATHYFLYNEILLLCVHLETRTSITINSSFVHFLESINDKEEGNIYNQEQEKYGQDSSWEEESDEEKEL